MAFGGAGGLEAGKAFVDLVPRLSPSFGQETSKLIGSGIKPGAGKVTSELEAAGAAGGSKAGAAAGRNLSSSITSSAGGIASSMTKVFAGIGAVRILGDSIGEAREAIKVGQLTDAVIKSTGATAGVTAEHVGNLANKLSLVAGVDDELIQSGENVLLTFTSVRNEVGAGNDVFDQATSIALDMSRALGTDLQGSIIQVGKALQDPIKGVSALRRVGVQLSDDQEKLVKSLVASGDVMGAQKVILAELTKEFGGAAAAAADPLDKASVAAKNAEESIGVALMPVLVNLSKVAADLAPTLAGMVSAFGALPGPVQSSVVALAGLSFVGVKLGKVASGIGGLGKAVLELGKVGVQGVVGLGKLGAAAGRLGVDVAQAAARVAVSTVRMIASFVTMAARGIASFVALAARAVVSAATTAASWIASAASSVASFVVMAAGAVINAAIVVAAWLAAAAPFILLGVIIAAVVLLIINNWDTISSVTVAIWQGIVDFIGGAVSSIVGFVAGLPGAVIGFFSAAFNGARDAVVGAAEGIIGFVAGLPGRILGALGDLGGLLVEAGKAIIRGLLSGAGSLVGSIRDFFVGLKDKIFGWKGPPSVDALLLIPAGKAIMQGLVAGAASELGSVERFFSSVPGVIDVSAGVRVNGARGNFADAAGFTPAASLTAGAAAPVIVHGPLIGVEALHVRNDDDIVTISRRLDQEKNRALRAAGKQASVLP